VDVYEASAHTDAVTLHLTVNSYLFVQASDPWELFFNNNNNNNNNLLTASRLSPGGSGVTRWQWI
jgi:hypothetical protein